MVTQAEIDIVINARNLATAELTKLKSSFGSVNSAVTTTAQSVQKAGSQFNTTKATTGALATSLGSVGTQAKSAAAGLDDSAKSAKSADSGFASVTKSAAAFGVGMVGAGSALSLFQSAVVGSIKSAQDLEKSVLNISTIKPEIDTKAVSASLLDMSTRVAQSSSQLADSLYNIFSSIELSQEDALALTEKFARGAVAAQTDAETFGTAVLGVMNAYKLSVGDADHISDVFFNTVNKGVITAQQLAANLGPVTQSAKAAGVSLDELGAFIAAVTKEGGDAAQNVNNLNNLLMKVTTTDAQKQLKALQIETTTATGEFRPLAAVLGDLKVRLSTMTEAAQLAAIQKIFPDIQARQGAQTIMSQIDLVNEAIETNKTQAGSAGAAYDKMAGSGAASTQIFLNNLSKIGTEIAQKVTPALADLTAGMTEFLQTTESGGKQAGGGFFGFVGREVGRTVADWTEKFDNAGKGIDELSNKAEAGGALINRAFTSATNEVYDFNVAQGAAIPATQAQVDALRAQAQTLRDLTPAVQGFNAETVGMAETQGQALTVNERLGAVFGITAETTEELVKEVAKLKGGMEEATKTIKGYADAATPMTEAAGRQDAALKGVVSQAEAMATVKLGPQMQEWATRAHELADASGATGKPLADLHTSIAMIAQGGPGAAQGVENLKNQVEGISAPTRAAAQADRDYLTAQGELQQSLLRTPALVNDLVASMKNFVNEFLVAIGRVPTGAKEAIRLTEDAVTIDLSQPGADLAISLANGFGKETIRIVDGAGNVIREVKGTLSAADMSPEGVAFMEKVAKGVTEGGLTVQESARKVLEEAGVAMNTEAQTAVTNTNTTLKTTGADEAIKTAVKEQATGIGKVIDPALAFEVTAAVQNANTTLGTVGDEATRTTVKTNATSVGSDFSKGWDDGINSVELIRKTRQIFSDAVSAVKGVLGIHSRSQVMFDAGVNFMQGFLDGTGSMAGALTDFVTGLAQSAFDKFKSTLGGIGGTIGDLFGGGGGSGLYTATSSGSNVELGRQMAAAYGWSGAEFEALNRLWTQESGWRTDAKNPTSGAFGIPQQLGHQVSGAYLAGDPTAQIAWGLDYIRGRYGSPSAALAFEQRMGWYGQGTNRPIRSGMGVVGEAGPEIFNLGPDGLSIFSHAQSKAMMGGRLPGFQAGTMTDPGLEMAFLRRLQAILERMPKEIRDGIAGINILGSDVAPGYPTAHGLTRGIEGAKGRKAVIDFPRTLLNEAEAWQNNVIAHEIGHAEAWVRAADLTEAAANHFEEIVTGLSFDEANAAYHRGLAGRGGIDEPVAGGRLSFEVDQILQLGKAVAGIPIPVQDANDALAILSETSIDFSGTFANLPTSINDGKAAIERIRDQIDLLNHELAYTDPYSDRAAAIKSEIGILQAWQGQIQSGIKVLENQQAAFLKSTTALEGATGAWGEMQRALAMGEQFGAGAGPINALMEAISTNTPEAGAAALQSLQGFLTQVQETLGPQAQETGNYLRFLLFQALDPANSGQRDELLGRFSTVFAEIQAQSLAAATLTGETFASAYGTALTSANLAERVGPTFTRLFDLLAQQAKEGSAQTIAQIGTLSVGIEREIGKLPEVLRGPLLQEWKAAWGTFFESGDITQLEDVATRANRALSLIPKGFAEAAPEIQAQMLAVIRSAQDMGISVEEAQKRLEAIGKTATTIAAGPFHDVDVAIQQLIRSFQAGTISAEDYDKAMQGLQATAATIANPKGGGFPGGSAIGQIVGRAGGGGVPYGWFTSGEMGAELGHYGPSGLHIFSNAQSKAMINGLSGGSLRGFAAGSGSAPGGSRGDNTQAELFAAFAAGTNTPETWAAWTKGMQQIAQYMADEAIAIEEAERQLAQTNLGAELRRFAEWVRQFGDQWLKSLVETEGVEAAFRAYHGRSSPSMAMVGAGSIQNPDAVVQRLDQLIVAVEAMTDRPVYVSPAEVGQAARDYETAYYRSRH